MSKSILVVGNLFDGFRFVGPFDDFDAATLYATDERIDEDNWVATLEPSGNEGVGQLVVDANTAKHTPGPWWIDEDGDYLCICEGEANEFGEREEVALLHCNRPSLRATQPQNARLIAAAPELLAALKMADDCVWGDVSEVAAWLSIAKSAINKAEGGAA